MQSTALRPKSERSHSIGQLSVSGVSLEAKGADRRPKEYPRWQDLGPQVIKNPTTVQFKRSGEAAAEYVGSCLERSGSLAGKQILDFGCGSGRVIIPLAERYPNAQFHGTDVDREAIEYAAEVAPNNGVGGHEYLRISVVVRERHLRCDLCNFGLFILSGESN